MVNEDDAPGPQPVISKPVIDRLGIAELRAYIRELEAEIAHAEAEIRRKDAHRLAADSVFRSS